MLGELMVKAVAGVKNGDAAVVVGQCDSEVDICVIMVAGVDSRIGAGGWNFGLI